MVDFIKNLFGGILSFFVGLFGGKKSQEQPSIKAATTKSKKRSGYFMELAEGEETNLAGVGRAAKDAVMKTLETAKDTTAKTIESAKDTTAKTLNTAKDTTAKTLDTAKDTTAKTLDTAKGTTTKTLEKVAPAKSNKSEPVAAQSSKEEATKTSEPTPQAPKVELVQTAEGVAAVPAKPTVIASTNGQKPTETTFAPKYLSPTSTSNGRRRPGPNMNPFLDMARQVKTPG